MKRTQIQLDDETHAALRRAAYEQGRSMSSLVRETLSQAYGSKRKGAPRTPKRFSFVGSGRSDQGRLAPVSERHDEALADALRPQKRR
jgi:antitoxin FitA-like protein